MIILFCIWQWYRLLTQLFIFYSRLSEFIKNNIIFWCLTACFNEISSSRGNLIYSLIDQMWDGESCKMPVCHVLLLRSWSWLWFVYLNEWNWVVWKSEYAPVCSMDILFSQTLRWFFEKLNSWGQLFKSCMVILTLG